MRKLITFSFPFCSLKVFRKNVVQFHTFIFLMLFYVSGSKNGGGMFIQYTIFHSRQFTSSFTEKFKPIFTTFLPLILKASA